jgi:3-(3-hydroxy-phenyl)propionate hydroxylase
LKKDADVAVIGFGPVGAVLAGLLGKNGVHVIVVEKDKGVFPLPRAAHGDHTGLRTIQELGCLDILLPKTVRNKRLDLLDANRELLARIPADRESISGLPASVYFYQPEFDATLRNAAANQTNVDVRLNTEMLKLSSDVRGVILEVRAPSENTESLRVDWVVGCDGAWSPVREAMNIKLTNLNFDEQWLVLDVKIKIPQASLPIDHVVEICDPARPHLSTPISENRQRFEFMLLPGEDPEYVKQPHIVEGLLNAWMPADAYQIERLAVYTFHGLVAERWRSGRVLIAGDAAHQTPPFLGQGMCTGIRDAANLAWKLARVVKHAAPDALLDTYERERRPHAIKVINAAIRIGKVICELDPQKAAERDRLLRANSSEMRKGLSFALPRLDVGPLVLQGGGGLSVQTNNGEGRSDDIVGSRFLVLCRTREALGQSADWWTDEVDAHIAAVGDLNNPPLNRWFDRQGADVVVVRPDRYVLGSGENLDRITDSVCGLLASAGRAGREASEARAL